MYKLNAPIILIALTVIWASGCSKKGQLSGESSNGIVTHDAGQSINSESLVGNVRAPDIDILGYEMTCGTDSLSIALIQPNRKNDYNFAIRNLKIEFDGKMAPDFEQQVKNTLPAKLSDLNESIRYTMQGVCSDSEDLMILTISPATRHDTPESYFGLKVSKREGVSYFEIFG